MKFDKVVLTGQQGKELKQVKLLLTDNNEFTLKQFKEDDYRIKANGHVVNINVHESSIVLETYIDCSRWKIFEDITGIQKVNLLFQNEYGKS